MINKHLSRRNLLQLGTGVISAIVGGYYDLDTGKVS